MITKCRFCDYQKEESLSIPILKTLTDKELPEEDWILWVRRLVETNGYKSYNSVKIHIGMKHKEDTYKYISPVHIFSEAEKKIING